MFLLTTCNEKARGFEPCKLHSFFLNHLPLTKVAFTNSFSINCHRLAKNKNKNNSHPASNQNEGLFLFNNVVMFQYNVGI